jgi:hypothetical protein
MGNEVTSGVVSEVNRLHAEIAADLKMTLEKVLRIGELLYQQKAAMKHGEFIPWMKANLTFTDRTARNYMKMWRQRDRLKTEGISDLTGAYKMIEPPPEEESFEDIIREIGFDCKHCKFPVENRPAGNHLLCIRYLKQADPGFNLQPIMYRIITAIERKIEKMASKGIRAATA